MVEHDQWITQAGELARAKRYDEAREVAMRVLREDGGNARALWIVASVTGSLNERRNALKALLRVQPDNLHAKQMLSSMEREAKISNTTAAAATSAATSTGTIRSIKPEAAPQKSQHMLLYAALGIAAVLIVAVVVAAVII